MQAQYMQVGGESAATGRGFALSIVVGSVVGGVTSVNGGDFVASRYATGSYTITLNQPFASGIKAFFAASDGDGGTLNPTCYATATGVQTIDVSCREVVYSNGPGSALVTQRVDSSFNFMVVGAR
jgi:hypothetical protein